MAGVAAMLADEIDWNIMGDEIFSFVGPRRRRQDVLDALRQLGASMEIQFYDPHTFITDGAHACVLVRAKVKPHRSGTVVDMDLCDVARVEGGKVVWFREYCDVKGVISVLPQGWTAVG